MARLLINVKLNKPTVSVENWTKESRFWKALSRKAGGPSGLFSLTIKAGYVIGVIHDICQSVGYLLEHPKAKYTTYVPAYAAFSSAVALLGRCIRGNTDLWGSVADSQVGFKWLAGSDQVGLRDDTVVVETSRQEYTVDMLTALGYYAGQSGTTTKKKSSGTHHFGEIDPEILEKMPPLLAEGLDRYWNKLQTSERMCNKLAQARVIGLKDWPVLNCWLLRDREDADAVPSFSDVFGKFDWSLGS